MKERKRGEKEREKKEEERNPQRFWVIYVDITSKQMFGLNYQV